MQSRCPNGHTFEGTAPSCPECAASAARATQRIGVVLLAGAAALALWGAYAWFRPDTPAEAYDDLLEERRGVAAGVAARDQRAIDRALATVRTRLREPAAAEFRSVELRRAADSAVVCGLVNSRNGFGGMSGFQRFAVVSGDVLLSEDDPQRVANACSGIAN